MSERAGSSAPARTSGGPSPARPGRHGLCPDCGRTFLLEGGEVPAEGLVVDCPACGAPLPLSAAPRRKRSYRIVSRPFAGAGEHLPADPAAAIPGQVAPATAAAPGAVEKTQRPPRPRKTAPAARAPRRRGVLLPILGLLVGLGGGGGLLTFLAGREGVLNLEGLIATPLWSKAVAGALPILGLGFGLLLRRRR